MFPNWLLLKENELMKEKFIIRAKIISLIRDFFIKNNFLEVETPTLVAHPGMEPHLDLFKTSISKENREISPAYLISSPEYAMKKLLTAGFPKIFQICRSYRKGETDNLHNPEFTILEWYRAHADYTVIMRDVENLFLYLLKKLQTPNSQFPISNLGKNFLIYQNQKIDLSLPWPRLTVKNAFKKYAGINLDKTLDRESMARVARAKDYTVNRDDRFEDIFFKIFLNEIEPNLGKGKPTILMDWPIQMAALSRKKASDPRYAERFEVYIAGLELGNAFSELTDPIEQENRLKNEQKLRAKMKKEVYNIDKEFIQALKIGMPPSGGIAMGVDRIVMLFTDAKSIEEVLFFPASKVDRI
jgi:lysyl-tRNA synthetase class 2